MKNKKMSNLQINNRLQSLKDLFVLGSIKQGGSWGGKECKSALSMDLHIKESFAIIILLLLLIRFVNFKKISEDILVPTTNYYKNNKRTKFHTIVSSFLSIVHISMYGMLIFYKFNVSSLINLFQPCHVILLLEGIALASHGYLGVSVTLLILPALTGCLLALIFPDTSGLFQIFEESSYWYQHYLILTVPLYLLIRDEYLASRIASMKTTLAGLWILSFLHFTFYEV
jgi:hypothetical protein